MEILVLGSGTSHGVPMIGCDCAVCRSDNPKNRRFRPSIVVRNEGRVILVDTTPELLGLSIRTLPVLHGTLPVLAYRFDCPAAADAPVHSAAYVTDVSYIPPETMAQLYDLDLLLLDAVRFDPHPTHFGLYQSLDIV